MTVSAGTPPVSRARAGLDVGLEWMGNDAVRKGGGYIRNVIARL
jgi:hypothetical protein